MYIYIYTPLYIYIYIYHILLCCTGRCCGRAGQKRGAKGTHGGEAPGGTKEAPGGRKAHGGADDVGNWGDGHGPRPWLAQGGEQAG